MRLSAPKRVTWWVALVLAILSVIAYLGISSVIPGNLAFFLMLIAYALMAIATAVNGL